MIQVEHLRKCYGHLVAVDDVSFTAQPGEIFGLLGPNGAGKTSTLRMLYGQVAPTAGYAKVDGIDVQVEPLAVQRRMGVLTDHSGLYTRLTARENIAYFGRLHGIKPAAVAESITQLADALSMHELLDRRTKGFSQGERMKVSLARALVHQPDYLLLDEPTNGLDVLTTRAVRRLLLNLKAAGKGIIFSSHLMHEVALLCDRIAIVAAGRVMAHGTIMEVQRMAGADSLEDAFTHFAYGSERVHA